MLAFPRGAGGVARPVWTPRAESWGEGYVLEPTEQKAKALPLPTGAFVYSAGVRPGSHGVLYMVWKAFDPKAEDVVYLSEESDLLVVHGAQLTRSLVASGKARGYAKEGGKVVYQLDLTRDAKVADRAFAPGVGCRPWQQSADLLWCVDHLVKEVASDAEAAAPVSGTLEAKRVARRRFTFDYRRAEQEIARGLLRREQMASEAAAAPAVPTVADDGDDATSLARPALEGLRRSRRGQGEPSLNETMSSPDRMERRLRAERKAACEPPTEQMAALELSAALAPAAAEAAAAELRAARQSAEEAAAARNKPPLAGGGQRSEKPLERLPPTGAHGRQQNRYSGTLCAGCGEAIAMGAMMVQGGSGVVHEGGVCRELAERTLQESIAARKAGKAESQVTSEKRTAQLSHRFSDARLQMMRCCIEGRCTVTEEQEKRVYCTKGCGRGVHMIRCLQMSSNRAKLGALICATCRASEMTPYSCTPPERLVVAAGMTMLLELTTGKEGTAAGYSDFARLERQWVQWAGGGGDAVEAGSIVLPRHSLESFLSFTTWLVTDADRARSFGTIVRSAAGVLEKLELTNWTKHARVKAAVKELEQSRGVEAEPCTHATRRIVRLMLDETLAERVSPRLLARARVQVVLELMGGVRVGEATGGGDGHGALANNLCIMRPVGEVEGCEDESVELWLEDSKTGFARYVNFVGTSRGIKLEAARYVRELWREYGLRIEQTMEDGMIVERPDYSVVRVSLLDMDDATFKSFTQKIARSYETVIAMGAKATLAKAHQRRKAVTKGEEHKYVNIAGGARGGAEVAAAMAWLKASGLERYADVTKGPLLRASHGNALSHMPYQADSSYESIIGAMSDAYELSKVMSEPDVELDLAGREEPKWGHHSLRRAADRIARDTMAETGVDKGDIDDMFGWKQKERSKDMQLHYAGRRDRARRARITMMV